MIIFSAKKDLRQKVLVALTFHEYFPLESLPDNQTVSNTSCLITEVSNTYFAKLQAAGN